MKINSKAKRLISLLLCVLIVSATCAIAAFAEELEGIDWSKEPKSGDYNYTVIGGNICLTHYTNTKNKNVTIPETLAGRKVTEIGAFLFEDAPQVESVHIGKSVEFIYPDFASEAKGLKTISVSSENKHLTVVDNVLFRKNMKTLIFYLPLNPVSDYTVPDGVEELDLNAFSYCSGLKSVTMPNSVKYIGMDCFRDCTNLKSIKISANLKEIGDNAFKNCSKLESLSFPAATESLSGYFFDGCSSLKEINVDKNNKSYTSVDGVLFSKDKTELIKYPAAIAGDSYTVPESTTKIGECAFENATVKSIIISASLKKIGENAFEYCKNLTDIYYSGSESDWNDIHIEGSEFDDISEKDENDYLLKAKIHYGITEEMINSVVELDRNEVEINPASAITLKATVKSTVYDESDITWSSLNPDIATVDKNGNVVGVSLGTATIEAALPSGSSEVCMVKVTNRRGVTAVEVEDIKINYDKTQTVTPNITCDTDYTVTYKTSDSEIAVVDAKGNLSAKARGTATITCTVTDTFGNSKSCDFEVKVKFHFGQWILFIFFFGWIWM